MCHSRKDIANHIFPTRYVTKPLEEHYQCLCEHISLCGRREEMFTIAISFTQTDLFPFQSQRLLHLHKLRETCCQEANICRDAMSPIHWIPNETLGEIFSYCLPPDHRFSRDVAPLLLCQVSVWWREVAQSTPALWSVMAFWTPPHSNTDLTCYPAHRLSRWCQYIGNAPLSLFFERGLVYHHLKLFTELVLLGHYSQCRHLTIHLAHESAFALIHFLTLPPGSLSLLESLVLENLDEADFADPDPRLGPAITVFRDAPLLRKLTTNFLDFTFSNGPAGDFLGFDLWVVPWNLLTHIMITGFVRVEVFIVALSQCISLEYLRVSLDLSEDEGLDSWSPRRHITLSNLTEFYLNVAEGVRIPSLLDFFKFPALKVLRFRRSQDITPNQPLDLFSWTRSQHFGQQLLHLEQLSLVGRVGPPEQIIALLQNAPSLTVLSLDIWTEYPSLIPSLFPTPNYPDYSSQFILPFLTHMELNLTQQELPFPSNHIIVASEHLPHWKHLMLFFPEELHGHDTLQEMAQDFELCPLGVYFGLTGELTRLGVDAILIECECTNRSYNMAN